MSFGVPSAIFLPKLITTTCFAERADELHVVLDHQQRDIAVLADRAQLPLQIVGLGRVEAGRRLVEQQKPRMRHQRAHQFDPLLHAVRQAADRGALVFAETRIVQGRTRLLLPAVVAGEIDRLQHAEEAAIARMLTDDDIFQRVQMRHQAHILETARDAMIDAAARRNLRDVDAVDMDRCRDRPHRRR